MERNDWQRYLDRLGNLSPELSDCLPNALVISPPKTGTTWLYARLREHPGFFLPDKKEVRYFCEKWRFRNLDWYAGVFAAGRERIKVDVSPTYSLLPRIAIHAIRDVNPTVKLIFLMRDPVSRAWSHAKHMCVYGEGNFRGASLRVPEVRREHWLRNFIHDFPLASGTYAACLNRWLEFFPADQIHVGFFEDVARVPGHLLERVCRFLGATVHEWPEANLTQRVNEGSPELAAAESLAQLRFVLRRRTQQALDLLEAKFRLQVPQQWSNTLSGSTLDCEYPFTTVYRGQSIVYDGNFFRAVTGAVEIGAPMLGQLRIMLEHTEGEPGPQTEDAALEQALDSVLAPHIS
jgi:hypothetical protein